MERSEGGREEVEQENRVGERKRERRKTGNKRRIKRRSVSAI